MIGEIIKYHGFDVKEGNFPFSTKRGINIPGIIWNYENGNKYCLKGIQEVDYGGGYSREVGIYECIALADWAKED